MRKEISRKRKHQIPDTSKKTRSFGRLIILGIVLSAVVAVVIIFVDFYRNDYPGVMVSREKYPSSQYLFLSMHRALSSYYEDNQSYPPTEENGSIPPCLTTPIAYLSVSNIPTDELFHDIFPSTEYPEYSYHFYEKHNIYILQSNGPDRDRDLTDYSIIEKIDPNNQEQIKSIIHQYRYDPTNGVFSNGDVLNLNIEGLIFF